MTKDEYWAAHVKKHPKFADEEATIKIKVGMLRRLMEEAYDRGLDHGRESGGLTEMFNDLFKPLTGK